MQAIAASEVPKVKRPPPRKSRPMEAEMATFVPYRDGSLYLPYWYLNRRRQLISPVPAMIMLREMEMRLSPSFIAARLIFESNVGPGSNKSVIVRLTPFLCTYFVYEQA